MTDVVSPEVRSRMMAGIRGQNTKPELVLRKGLHIQGFRFRLHDRRLPGKPDIVFRKYKAVLFAHGCFWHRHNCHLFKWPSTRSEFWRKKIMRNRALDARAIHSLKKAGWRVGIVWECALKGKSRLQTELIIGRCAKWLKSSRRSIVIRGTTGRTRHDTNGRRSARI